MSALPPAVALVWLRERSKVLPGAEAPCATLE
jgi:hypothetical protein